MAFVLFCLPKTILCYVVSFVLTSKTFVCVCRLFFVACRFAHCTVSLHSFPFRLKAFWCAAPRLFGHASRKKLTAAAKAKAAKTLAETEVAEHSVAESADADLTAAAAAPKASAAESAAPDVKVSEDVEAPPEVAKAGSTAATAAPAACRPNPKPCLRQP